MNLTNLIPWTLSPLALLVALPFLDRWGGGDFNWLPFNIPKMFQKGCTSARKYGIPIAIWLAFPTFQIAFCMVAFGLLLSLNLDWIEDKEWIDGYIISIGYALCLWLVAGWWGIGVSVVWMLGVFLSNNVIGNTSLPWRYVEGARGLTMAVAINLNQLGG